MARRVIVAGASQRLEESARAEAIARADAWASAWADASPGFDAVALRESLRDEAGVRAIHFTIELARDRARATTALGALREKAGAAMSLALRDPELVRSVAAPLAALGGPPPEATAAILDSPGALADELGHIAALFIRSISERTDVTRFVYPEAYAKGERVSASAEVPRLGERELAWLLRFIDHENDAVRAAILPPLSSSHSYLRGTPIAEAVLAHLEDPVCQYWALRWTADRPDLVPIERLQRLLGTTSRPGPVWYALVERGQVDPAIAAFAAADDETRHDLVMALSDHGGRTGRAVLLAALESEATERSLRQSILARFGERGEAAIYERFARVLYDE